MSLRLFADLEDDPTSLFAQVKAGESELKIDEIIECVCTVLDVDKHTIKGKGSRGRAQNDKARRIRFAKYIITSILYELTGLSLEGVAVVMNLADHSTVHYRLKRLHKLYKEDKEFRKLYSRCLHRLHRERHPTVHNIAGYLHIEYNAKMPRELVYQLHRIDNWLAKTGFELGIKPLKER